MAQIHLPADPGAPLIVFLPARDHARLTRCSLCLGCVEPLDQVEHVAWHRGVR